MKAILKLVCIFFVVQNYAQTPPSPADRQIIDFFVSSSDFRNNSLINTKTIDYNKSSVVYDINFQTIPRITVTFVNKGKIIGTAEAIKKTTATLKLPNNNDYFMFYRDFTGYDLTTNSGTIKFFDLNYDNYLFNTITYSNMNSTGYNYIPLPSALKTKYASIIAENAKTIANKGHQLCDGNGNGNVSFSECYQCFNVACQTQAGCYTLCYGFGDVLGWVGIGFPHCQASIGIACAYIASIY